MLIINCGELLLTQGEKECGGKGKGKGKTITLRPGQALKIPVG
jgi:hypothetical protein